MNPLVLVRVAGEAGDVALAESRKLGAATDNRPASAERAEGARHLDAVVAGGVRFRRLPRLEERRSWAWLQRIHL